MATRDFIRKTDSSRACMNQRKVRLTAARMGTPKVAATPKAVKKTKKRVV